jgi:hypothetical protein
LEERSIAKDIFMLSGRPMENAPDVRSAARPARMWPFEYGERVKKDDEEVKEIGNEEL